MVLVPLAEGAASVQPVERAAAVAPRARGAPDPEDDRAVGCGTRLYREFSTCLDVSGVLDDKRAALAEYRSQTTRYLPDPRWATLGDVGGGAFLDALLAPTERFHRTRWSPASEPR